MNNDLLTAATDRLDRALAAARTAEVELATAAVHLVCLQVRSAAPTATTIVFDWSDQGDWLLIADVQDASGVSIAADWDDEDNLAANLEGATESVWLPFMTPPADGAIRKPTDVFRLEIDVVLARYPRSAA